MITLRDILKLNETVTLLELWVRQPDGRLITRSKIGQPYHLSTQEERDIEDGKLEYIDTKINIHLRVNSKGVTEIAYGMDWKAIPKKYLDAEVTDLNWLHSRYGGVHGSVLDATIVPIQMRLDLEA